MSIVRVASDSLARPKFWNEICSACFFKENNFFLWSCVRGMMFWMDQRDWEYFVSNPDWNYSLHEHSIASLYLSIYLDAFSEMSVFFEIELSGGWNIHFTAVSIFNILSFSFSSMVSSQKFLTQKDDRQECNSKHQQLDLISTFFFLTNTRTMCSSAVYLVFMALPTNCVVCVCVTHFYCHHIFRSLGVNSSEQKSATRRWYKRLSVLRHLSK